MSFDFNFSFGPTTPPEYSFEQALEEASFTNGHSRQSSQGSNFSQESSPVSSYTQLTTPTKSPIRQHGPLLLPKIRPQDQAIESPPKRFKKTPLATAHNPAWRPSHNRSYTNPESVSLLTPVSASTNHSRSSSALCSPISMTEPNVFQRRGSGASLDGQTLGKYGFPTYRQMPTYIPSATNTQTETFVPQPYFIPTPREPSPIRNEISFDVVPDNLSLVPAGTTTTLMSYLTGANPAPSLVRQLNIHVRDSNAKHFWWDIRQIRPWTSFTPSTISSIPDLHALLNIPLPSTSFPTPPPSRTSHPETEAELHSIYSTYYTTKLNAALALAQGNRHLMMRPSTAPNQPSFISNYTDDTSELIYGRGLGRVVGLVKSFDRWNSGMRVEGNHKKVEYLRGLAHLHKCMREHGCRYGFIMTEIEMVVVRNGAEGTPHFGYLEVQTIQLAEHDSLAEGEIEVDEEGNVLEKEVKMTALLALFYLHMLARDVPLPGQVAWKTEIGAPAEGTRRKCLPKDEWMPEPQLAEKREAKRCRGWVWPEEGVGRKELGRRGVRYGSL